ncbi:MAG: SdpI family protein [Verrucomicrobiota bacterium]
MKNKLNWLEAVLLIAPFAILAALWSKLPSRVPIHWNIRGEIDGWSSKTTGMLILPLTGLAVVVLLHILSWLDPKLRRSLHKTDRMHRVLQILRLVFAAFFGVLSSVQIAVALDQTIPSGRMLMASILILLAVLGNYFGNLRPNYFFGIRTPWTLENPETWRATHRLGGRLIFFGSLFLLILQFFLSQSAFGFVFVTLMLLLVVWAFVYSWNHFRTHAAARETI